MLLTLIHTVGVSLALHPLQPPSKAADVASALMKCPVLCLGYVTGLEYDFWFNVVYRIHVTCWTSRDIGRADPPASPVHPKLGIKAWTLLTPPVEAEGWQHRGFCFYSMLTNIITILSGAWLPTVFAGKEWGKVSSVPWLTLARTAKCQLHHGFQGKH